MKKISAAALAVILLLLSAPAAADAAPVAGLSDYTQSTLTTSSLPTAGVSAAFTQAISDGGNLALLAQVKENLAPAVSSEYADIAVSTVLNYVNIRQEPSEESEKVGKLYANCVGTVLGTKGDWYLIRSGNVTGYVHGDYVTVGDESLARSVGRRIATVTTETLRVRKEPSEDSEIIALVAEEEDLTVVDESKEGWIGVSVEAGNGYVSSEYVQLGMEYHYGESKEEEERRLAKEEEERKAAEAAAAKSTSSLGSSGVSRGQQVANYAAQFLGNPYVYGGSSLTNGTDCSGFVMSVYAHFGVSLPHSSSALRSVGYGVSTSAMQPGDIVCYSGHVAIYVGGNTVISASNRRDGIKYTSPANYKKILAVRRIF